jgi:hypothetical protein
MEAGDRIRVGTVLETAIWYDANETPDPVAVSGSQIADAFKYRCKVNRIKVSDVKFTILLPGNPRVPEVPRWLEKIPGAIPRLLLAEVIVLGSLEEDEPPGLVSDLDKKDLQRLRAATRRAHRKARPHETTLSDHECDKIINAAGIETVMQELRNSVKH